MSTPNPDPAPRIVRPMDVQRRYNLADNTLRGWEAEGIFPKRRKFGPRVVGWFTEDFERGLRNISRESAE